MTKTKANSTDEQGLDLPVQSHSMGCCSAALAGLLGLPLSDVPDFWTERQFGDVVDWLKQRGLCLQELVGERLWEGRYLVAGSSPRGNSHFVIYEDGKFLHDPHPEGGGLVEVTHTWLIYPRRLESLLSDRAKLEERVRELEMQRLSTLAGMYHLFPNAVAKMCDETLDRSGALLGEVRKLVDLNRSTDRG